MSSKFFSEILISVALAVAPTSSGGAGGDASNDNSRQRSVINVTAVDAVDALEHLYADFLDAHGAVEVIEAGSMAEVDGVGRAGWVTKRDELKEELSIKFKEINAKSNLKYSSRRALDSMRRTFEELTADGTDSTTVSASCADAPASTGGQLSAALYACFDSPGNQLPFEGQTLTRVGALQLLQELDDPARRRKLFMAMSPLWRAINAGNEPDSPYRRLLRSQGAAFAAGHTPIHEAGAAFGIDARQAERWLEQILEAWGEATAGGGSVEPWDYRYRHSAASRSLAALIPRERLLALQAAYFADLGADPAQLGILFDIDPRPGKAPLAYSDTVRIGRIVDGRWRPAIARVSANDDRGGLGILNELVHETGHAVHFMAIRARPAFFWPDTTFIEAFADVPSWAVYTPAWQQKYLGQAVPAVDSLREQYAGVILDVAWSLFELRMLRDPSQDPNRLWSDITARYLHIIPHPELSWWAVRSQLVTDPGYMIHYGLGAVITAQVRERTRKAIGPFDAGNPRWYAWLSERLLAEGGARPTDEQLRAFLGERLSPAALVRDIRSIGAPASH